MRKSNVIAARTEVIRVTKAIEDLIHSTNWQASGNGDYTPGCAETAALRRASLDLSKALSRLRNERG